MLSHKTIRNGIIMNNRERYDVAPSRSASRMKLKIRKTKYNRWLSRADDVACLTMIWAIRALQSGYANQAKKFIIYPEEAATHGISGDFAIYPWELETFVTSLLSVEKDRKREGLHHISNCSNFVSAIHLTNTLRDIESAEYVMRSKPEDIMEEMYRIGQRQFFWQRGPSTEELYRFAFVYGQGKCTKFFEEKYDISVSEFQLICFTLMSVFLKKPITEIPNTSLINVSREKVEKAFDIVSTPIVNARKLAVQLNVEAAQRLQGPLRVSYMPSILRRKPIIQLDMSRPSYISPLPNLIMTRATAGLYYDIRQGPKELLTEANHRFEEYIRLLVNGYIPKFKAFKGAAYGQKGRLVDPPDCLVKSEDRVVVAIECKTTKLTFEAQFSDNPQIVAARGFEQIAKGIFQLWRFFSHARRSIYFSEVVSPNAHGIVLTMDGWMLMAKGLRDKSMERARELASADPDIIDVDMRRVIFASVQELNDTLSQTNEAEFISVLCHATSDKYEGYGLPEVARDCGVSLVNKSYPMDVSALIPWWGNFKA